MEFERRELLDLLVEWEKTCKLMEIPFRLDQAVQFVDDAGWFTRNLRPRPVPTRDEIAVAVTDASIPARVNAVLALLDGERGSLVRSSIHSELSRLLDDSMLTHTGRSIGLLASDRVADAVLALLRGEGRG